MLTKIKFLTAGESHGKGLLGILDGIPAGLKIEKSTSIFSLVGGKWDMVEVDV